MLAGMRVLTFIAFASLVAALLPGCGSSEPDDPIARIQKRGVLVVATEAEFRPFEYVLPSGEIVGFDVDLARAVADDLGVKLELRNVKFEGIFLELRQGLADMIASGVTILEERRKAARFSDPYFFTVTALLVNKAKAAEIRSAADLNHEGRIVAVKQGTTGEKAAMEVLPKATRLSHQTENGAALDVAEGRADAFLYDLHSVEQHHAQHPDRTVLLSTPVTVENYALVVRLEDGALAERINAVLAAMRKDGRLAELMKRHGPSGSIEKP